MARTSLYVVLCLLLAVPFANAVTSQPDPDFSPGYLCTQDDPDFLRLDYAEKIARCKRHLNPSGKKKVADYYKIPKSKWSKYEFDHLIPLCAGGSNDLRNIFPQPQKEADKKDAIELKVCRGMKSGTMTQEQAVREIKAFFESQGILVFPEVY